MDGSCGHMGKQKELPELDIFMEELYINSNRHSKKKKKKKRDLSITTDMPIAGLAQCTAAVNVKNH